jgi:hypothetical protein
MDEEGEAKIKAKFPLITNMTDLPKIGAFVTFQRKHHAEKILNRYSNCWKVR